MTALLTLQRLFQIRSDKIDVQRKGQLLQVLVLFLSITATAAIVASLSIPVSVTALLSLFLQVVVVLLISILCLYLLSLGKLRLPTHLFFIAFSLVQFFFLFTHPGASAYAYFLLIPIVAIATLDSVRASAYYTVVIVATVLLYAHFTGVFVEGFSAAYFFTVLSISLTTWASANTLQGALEESKRMARNLQINTNLLQANTNLVQKRARQLQLSVEIGHMTSTSLELDQLLHTTVNLIRDQFGFYHVSVFLLDRKKQNLELREATGEAGKVLKAKKYKVAITSNSVVGWVAANQKARILRDVVDDPVYMLVPLLQETRSEMALPLLARGQLIGVLDVQSRKTDAFHQEDITILQILANQVAVNIDNARLFARTEERLNETESLFNLNMLLTTTLDVGEIYRRAARAFVEQLHIAGCAISSWERDSNTVTTQVEVMVEPESETIGEYHSEHIIYSLDNHTGTRKVLETRESIVRYMDEPDLEESEKQVLLELGCAANLEVPLLRGHEVVGIVELFRRSDQPPFDAGEIQLAQTMANQVAIALHNATLASEAQARVAQLSTLNRISTIFSLAPTLKEVFDGARREILSLIEATGMSIVLLTPEGDKLNWIYGFEYGQEVDLSGVPPLPLTQGFSGHVAQTREVLHINKGLDQLHRQFGSTTIGALSQSWLGLPLIVANQFIGVLAVENEHDDNAFSERDIELLKTIAGPLAITINNLNQFEQVQAALAAQSEQRLQLQTAAEIAAATTSIRELDELMIRAVNLIKERFDLYYVGLFLINPETNRARLQAGTGQAGQEQMKHGHWLAVGGRSLIGGATSDGKPRITQDVTRDKEWRPNPNLPDTRSELALPLRVRGRTIGALTVQSTLPNAFSPELISILQTMSDQLAIAIENAQLLSQAESRAERQRELNQISTRLHRSIDVNEIVNVGLRAISERLGGAQVELRLGKLSSHDSNSQLNDGGS